MDVRRTPALSAAKGLGASHVKKGGKKMAYYTGILQRALAITSRYRQLWLFAFASAFMVTVMGLGLPWAMPTTSTPPPTIPWGLFCGLFPILALVGILFVVLTQGALIGMVREIEATGATTVSSGWQTGRSRLLSLIGIMLILAIPLVLFGCIVMATLSATFRAGGPTAVIYTWPWMLFVFVGGALLGLIQMLAYPVCVIEVKVAYDALVTGLSLLRRNLRWVVPVWLVLTVISWVEGLLEMVVRALCGLLPIPSYSPLPAVGFPSLSIPPLATGPIPTIIALVFSVLVSGFVMVFTSTAWTVLYLRLPVKE
jgi:hypothetical protein